MCRCGKAIEKIKFCRTILHLIRLEEMRIKIIGGCVPLRVGLLSFVLYPRMTQLNWEWLSAVVEPPVPRNILMGKNVKKHTSKLLYPLLDVTHSFRSITKLFYFLILGCCNLVTFIIYLKKKKALSFIESLKGYLKEDAGIISQNKTNFKHLQETGV